MKPWLALLILTTCVPIADHPVGHRFLVVDASAAGFEPATKKMVEAFQAAGAPVYWDQGYVAEGDVLVHVAKAQDYNYWPDGKGGSVFTMDMPEGGYALMFPPGIGPGWVHMPITMVHEMGHTWGLCHSKDKTNVMYKSSGFVDDIDKAVNDVLTAVRAGGNCQ